MKNLDHIKMEIEDKEQDHAGVLLEVQEFLRQITHCDAEALSERLDAFIYAVPDIKLNDTHYSASEILPAAILLHKATQEKANE